jgi:CRISPR system Cascade subunit CasB
LSTEKPGDAVVDAFVSRLEELAQPGSEDRASLARLKRGAGRPLAECGSLMPLFYRLLPASIRWQSDEENHFLVATLFPFAPRRWSGDLGASLRLLRSQAKINEEGLDRRMAILLDAARAELPFRLRQVVRLLAQHELPLDWRQLLQDLRRWEQEGRWVQKQWARSYFGWSRDEAGESSAPPAEIESDSE